MRADSVADLPSSGRESFQSAQRPCGEFCLRYQQNKKKDPWGPARQNRLMCWNIHQALKQRFIILPQDFTTVKKSYHLGNCFIFPNGNCQVNNRNTGFELQSPLPQICPVSISFLFFFRGSFLHWWPLCIDTLDLFKAKVGPNTTYEFTALLTSTFWHAHNGAQQVQYLQRSSF